MTGRPDDPYPKGSSVSLHPQDPPPVPDETRRVARAAFPNGTLCLHIAEALKRLCNRILKSDWPGIAVATKSSQQG
jgi:hypothetical protein